MPERLKDKRRPFIFNLLDILLSPNQLRIRDTYDEADAYLFPPKKEKKDKKNNII